MIGVVLLTSLLSAAPEATAEPPPPPETFYRFEVWSEPVSLVGSAVLGGMSQTAAAIGLEKRKISGRETILLRHGLPE